jgi:hypothetical protein
VRRKAWFTVASPSYWTRVLVLAESLKRWHPQDDFVLVAVDHPSDELKVELRSPLIDLVIDTTSLHRFHPAMAATQLSIVEFSTSVKADSLITLFDMGYESVGYLDPDTVVFSELSGLEACMRQADLVLVPHQLTPDFEDWAIRENEIGTLKHGTFNFGCLLVRNSPEGRRFAEWWSHRLSTYCLDSPCEGLFTDQKWGDLVPIFFPSTQICRHAGVNVASWNLRERRLSFDDRGQVSVNLRGHENLHVPLELFHFTKAESAGQFVTARHAGSQPVVAGLWRWYLAQIRVRSGETVSQ